MTGCTPDCPEDRPMFQLPRFNVWYPSGVGSNLQVGVGDAPAEIFLMCPHFSLELPHEGAQ